MHFLGICSEPPLSDENDNVKPWKSSELDCRWDKALHTRPRTLIKLLVAARKTDRAGQTHR
jgi:hypothetical protein